MKVLFLIDTLQGSGAERSMVEIAQHFKNFTPVFVHIYKGDMLKSVLENTGIKVYSLNIQKKYGFAEAVKKLIPIFEIEKPDIVHSTLYRADMVARKMKNKFPHIPLVGSFVNNSYTSLRYKDQSITMKLKLWLSFKMDKVSSRKVDFYISNSETIKKSEGEALGIPPSKIKTIYRGRDLKKIENIDKEQVELILDTFNLRNKNILLNVSRLIHRKAQLDIIRALPDVLRIFPDTVLLIAGHGDFENILKRETEELCLTEHVVLLGRRNDVPEMLHLSSLFVYPSYSEGLPGALIEAMLAQKIIIASNIEENLECVDDNSALIFEKGNIKALSHKIINSIQQGSKLAYLGIEAKRQALEKFEIGAISKQYEDVYHQILNKQI